MKKDPIINNKLFIFTFFFDFKCTKKFRALDDKNVFSFPAHSKIFELEIFSGNLFNIDLYNNR